MKTPSVNSILKFIEQNYPHHHWNEAAAIDLALNYSNSIIAENRKTNLIYSINTLMDVLNDEIGLYQYSSIIEIPPLVHSDDYYIYLGNIIACEIKLVELNLTNTRDMYGSFMDSCTELFPNLAYLYTILTSVVSNQDLHLFEDHVVTDYILNHFDKLNMRELLSNLANINN